MPRRPAEDFAYPAHIDRGSLDALPGKPGVYLFRDRRAVPIYIGKSVNLRSCALSHLRVPQEAAMLRQTRRIDFVRTAGEPYALALSIDEATGRTSVEAAGAGDPPREGRQLFGLFAAAQEGLRLLLWQHGLCPTLLGLESTTHGRACFSHQIGRCRGACIGKESAPAHRLRLQRPGSTAGTNMAVCRAGRHPRRG